MKYFKRTASILALLTPGLVAFAADTPDSEQVNKLLSDAKTQAFQLKEDAGTMQFLSTTGVTWQDHAAIVNEIKEHVNSAGRILAKLEDARAKASPWQATAIDRVKPLLKELASNTDTIIAYLNKNPGRLQTAEYKDYLEANSDNAEELLGLITDFVNYGKTKHRLERLQGKLEVPTSGE